MCNLFQDDRHAPLTFDDKRGILYDEESELNTAINNRFSDNRPFLASGTYTTPVSPPDIRPAQGPRHQFGVSDPDLQWRIGANHQNEELGGDGTSLALSVSPAPGKTADPCTLPHMVLRDPHLPWARNASAGKFDEDETNVVPWLALVTFTANELALTDDESKSFFSPGPNDPNAKPNSNMGWDFEAAAASKIYDSIPPSPGINRLTNLVPRVHDETSTVNTSVIAIRHALFTALFAQGAPNETKCSIDKYRFLAHVCEIKSTESEKENSSTSSVVISHRTGPLDTTAPTRVYVHLISLKGIDGIKTAEIKERVLLTSLYSWSYTAVPGSPDARAAAFEQLGKFSTDPTRSTNGLPMLRVNYQKESISKEMFPTRVEQQLMTRLDQGYSMIRYRTQTGEETAAFMRGVLAPVQVPHPSRSGVPSQLNSGFGLQLLDAELGIVDISYDAAWNLGKTMAMKDRAFTTALARLRRDFLNSASTDGRDYNTPENSDYSIIQEWVLDKTHLSGIPSQYLISDASIVPKESMRFFYIDQNWIDSLVDGALSLSNHQILDPGRDQCRTALKIKLNEGLSRPIENPKYLQKPPVYGFILRSEILDEFQGLGVKAEFKKQFYARNEFDTKRRAPVLQRRLDKDTILVLFYCQPPTLQRIKLAVPVHQNPFSAASVFDKKQNVIQIEFDGTEPSEPSLKEFQLTKLFDWDARTIKITEYAKMFDDFLEETYGTTTPITPAGFALMLRGRAHALDVHLVTSDKDAKKAPGWGDNHVSSGPKSATEFYFINPKAPDLIPVNINSQQIQDEFDHKLPVPSSQESSASKHDGSSIFALQVTAIDSRYVPTNRPKPVDLIFNIHMRDKPPVPNSKLKLIKIRVSLGEIVDGSSSPFESENEFEHRPLIQRNTASESPGPTMVSNLSLNVLQVCTEDEVILDLIPRSKEGVDMSTLKDTSFLLPMVNVIPWRIPPGMRYRSWMSMKWIYQVNSGEAAKTKEGEGEFIVYMSCDSPIRD